MKSVSRISCAAGSPAQPSKLSGAANTCTKQAHARGFLGFIPHVAACIVRKRFDSTLHHYTRFFITWQHFLRRCSVFAASSRIPGDQNKGGGKPHTGFLPLPLYSHVNSRPLPHPGWCRLSWIAASPPRQLGRHTTRQRRTPHHLSAWCTAVLSWRA
jgi:hypothetical protein